MVAATGPEESDPAAEARLRIAEESIVSETRRTGADIGIVMLSDPLVKQDPVSKPWAPKNPWIYVSNLLYSNHIVDGEFHLNAEGHGALVSRIEPWITREWCQ